MKIVLCSKFPWTEFIDYMCFDIKSSEGVGACVRAKQEQVKTLNGLLPASQGRNLALTVLYVPSLLDRDQKVSPSRGKHMGTSLIRRHPLLAPHRRAMPRAVWWS